jgi:hypothetical protein
MHCKEGRVHFSKIIAAMWLAFLCTLGTAHADKRVALVIGNGAYRHADRLDNPVNDARGVRDALKSSPLGFEVVYGEDLDQRALRRKIGEFAGLVGGADVAIVYFAGHGATFGDTPYVVPVDAEFSNLDEVPYELIAVETLIGELRRAKGGVRIAILDACRDNAAERSLKRARGEGTRGLGPMKNPDGLILAYATQYLSTAVDGGGGHSPFTAALLHNIATPGLDVKDVFFNIGHDVVAATASRQRPEISVSIYERSALVPAPRSAGVSPASPPGPGVAGSNAEQSQQSCTTQLEASPRHYTARVTRFLSEQEVLEKTMRVEGREQARISPSYRLLRHVYTEVLAPDGSPEFLTMAAIPEYLTVKVGDMVDLISRHRDPTLPCNFIPWTINRIIAREGTR